MKSVFASSLELISVQQDAGYFKMSKTVKYRKPGKVRNLVLI